MSPFPNDPYCYPGTDVLINKGDFRSQIELNKFEADAVFLAVAAFRIRPIAGRLDSARLQETHRRIFGNVYPWTNSAKALHDGEEPLRLRGRLRAVGKRPSHPHRHLRETQSRA